MSQQRIYLDFNASTPLCPEARAAMLPLLEEAFGNPQSDHWAGRPAREAIEAARAQVASLIGAQPDEIVFTSGATEANNAAIRGVWAARGRSGGRIAISAVEHPAVVEPCRALAAAGARLERLPVDRHGRVQPAAFDPGPDCVLLTVMHANNEVGTLQPVVELAAAARAAGAVAHTDAAQSVGKIPVDVGELGVDLLSLAGHKLHGPKGVGALYLRRGAPWAPLILGSRHQQGRRAGTESALLAAGLGAACAAAAARLAAMDSVRRLRDRLWERLRAGLGARVVQLGHPELRLPNTLMVAFPGRLGADVLARCPGLAASTGAACRGRDAELSPTLRAMNVDPAVGAGAVRLSLGRTTTAAEVDDAAALLIAAASRGAATA